MVTRISLWGRVKRFLKDLVIFPWYEYRPLTDAEAWEIDRRALRKDFERALAKLEAEIQAERERNK